MFYIFNTGTGEWLDHEELSSALEYIHDVIERNEGDVSTYNEVLLIEGNRLDIEYVPAEVRLKAAQPVKSAKPATKRKPAKRKEA